MRNPKTRKLLLVISCLLFVCIVVNSSLASSCVRHSLEENCERMDIIFTGTVVQKQDAPDEFSRTIFSGPDYEESEIAAVQVKFSVGFEWKGDVEDHVTLYTLKPQESEWGYAFRDKGRYLVFARIEKSKDEVDSEEDERQIWTNLCYQNVDLDGFFGDAKEIQRNVRSILSETDEVKESKRNVLDRRSFPFLHGVKNETALNKRLAVFKLGANVDDAKALRTDTETSTSSN